jgi:hypothetical protein
MNLLKSEVLTLTAGLILLRSTSVSNGQATNPPTRNPSLISAQPVSALIEKEGKWFQPVEVRLSCLDVPTNVTVRIEGAPPLESSLTQTEQQVQVDVAAVSAETSLALSLEAGGKALETRRASLKPIPKLVVYVLPHSHTDIGYTEIQTAVEEKQIQNLIKGMELARKTAQYPEGARFVWNVEVLWAVDSYLRRMSSEKRTEFLEAVKNGSVALNGMYLNELTGLCRPEELLRLFRYSTQLASQTGTRIDAAMISDVPGYTWGTVTAMAQAGIKYFSAAPNYFDRIGDILVQWENKPFYWLSPSGNEKVLVWIPYRGYALSHMIKQLSPEFVTSYLAHLDETHYPYDIAYIRWSGHGDNAEPDPAICEFIKDWNARYAYPKFFISSTSRAFRAFEERYSDKLPQVRGDWTPYWEDGAGSSAAETAMNRASADRLTQAETLWAMLDPKHSPSKAFDEAWRSVLLYSEHTWGADCSVSDPEREKTKEQWAIKRSYAVAADQQSRELVAQALAQPAQQPGSSVQGEFDVLNTTSWPRTELVNLSRQESATGDQVLDDRNKPVPSQRLSNDALAFIAREVPPFAARRYRVSAGKEPADESLHVTENLLQNRELSLRIDTNSGAIIELRGRQIPVNLVDAGSGEALNDYLFLPGDDLANLQHSGPATIKIKENGPVVASLLIESEAPGCRMLTREVRLYADADYLEVIDTVDKLRAAIPPKPPDWQFAQKGGKESVNFTFPFNVPRGDLVIDTPLGVMEPEVDQIAGSCKNWFPVSRWVDVSNPDFGVTWVTLDAPLIEVGELSARLLGSQTNPTVWRRKVNRTQRFYAWVMNNHWGTNYRGYQDGPTVFRFILRPHRAPNPGATHRFAMERSQPLVVVPARTVRLPNQPRLIVESEQMVVNGLKPSDDGKGLIVRLFNATKLDQTVRLRWSDPKPTQVWQSDTAEEQLQKIGNDLNVPGHGLLTLRAEQP